LSEGPNLNVARYGAQADGTATSALIAGGIASPGSPEFKNNSEEWDGSSWTATPNINTARGYVGHAGTAAASIIFAGRVSGPATSNAGESWNGSTWTSGPNLNVSDWGRYGGGTSIAALSTGNSSSGAPNGLTEEWDDSSWTAVNQQSTGRAFRAQAGTQTDCIVFGSNNPAITTTEAYDGTNWSAKPSMATARDSAGGSGIASAAICFANAPASGITEEFNVSANVITAGAWASGGAVNTGRYGVGGFGATKNAAVVFVGRNTPIYNKTEEYNGTSWTEVNNYPISVNDPGSTGTLTAGLGLGGLYPNDIGTFPTTGPATYEYDGTNWTSGGAYTYNAWATEMAGTQTAAIASGGHNYPMPPGNRNNSAEYNGSSWTSGNNMSQVRAMFAAGGSQTASFACGGRGSPGVEDPINATEEYDGTNWSTGGNYLTVIKQNTAGGGPQTAGYMAGGTPAPPPDTTTTGTYDGTSWSTAPNLPAKQSMAGSTTNNTGPSNAMTFAGAPGGSTVTYEFTGETTAINVKTLTQS